MVASFVATDFPGVVVLGSALLEKTLSLWPSGWLFPSKWLNSEYKQSNQFPSCGGMTFPTKSAVTLSHSVPLAGRWFPFHCLVHIAAVTAREVGELPSCSSPPQAEGAIALTTYLLDDGYWSHPDLQYL